MRKAVLVVVASSGVVIVLMVAALWAWGTAGESLKAAWIQALSGLFVGLLAAVAAVYAASLNSRLRDHLDARIAERRLEAYQGLWSATGRLGAARTPASPDELRQVADELTNWYFAGHGGMLLDPATQSMFVRLRDNLSSALGSFKPASWQELIGTGTEPGDRWVLLQRQASLLRTQMKIDCGVYFPGGVSTGSAHRPYDADFLGAAAGREPWREAFRAGGELDAAGYRKRLRAEFAGPAG